MLGRIIGISLVRGIWSIRYCSDKIRYGFLGGKAEGWGEVF